MASSAAMSQSAGAAGPPSFRFQETLGGVTGARGVADAKSEAGLVAEIIASKGVKLFQISPKLETIGLAGAGEKASDRAERPQVLWAAIGKPPWLHRALRSISARR
ncbi:MAG: hypothetical protein ACR2FX_08860 [Chthoniobacterales bacterium]